MNGAVQRIAWQEHGLQIVKKLSTRMESPGLSPYSQYFYSVIKKCLFTWRTIPTQLMSWRWPSLYTFGMWTVLYWTPYSFKYNQEDETLYNILYYCQCCTCFRRFLRCLLAATSSGSSKQAWHIPAAVCTVLSSWWWAEKPPETCRALTVIKNIV